MNDNETRVFENHAQDARVREVGEREGGGLPVYRTDRRELSVDERQQPAPARAAGGRVMRDDAIGVDLYNAQVTGRWGCVGDAPSRQLGRRPRPVRDCLAVRTANTGANGCGVAVEVCHTLDLASGQGVLVDYE